MFDDVGVGIRDNSWNGFNCSLFAYGQTGSGKSYSIIGKYLADLYYRILTCLPVKLLKMEEQVTNIVLVNYKKR